MFSEKTIMVTGGTGSIGQYLIRKMCKENPKRIKYCPIDPVPKNYCLFEG